MARIENIEGNVELYICLKEDRIYDYIPQRSDYENWIPFTLKLVLPNRCNLIDEESDAAVTFYEIKNFINGLERVLECFDAQENFIYEFNSSEGFFGLRIELLLEDNVVEIELWINSGIQSKGVYCGFDEGVRFISSKDNLTEFFTTLRKELDLCLVRLENNNI